MATFFWDYDDYNDIEREWICFILNGLAFLFTAVALVRTVQFHGKFMFEVVPLSFNLVATLILLLLKLFEKGYEFEQIGYFIEIFTYFLFCYTFAVVLIKVKESYQARRFRAREKLCNVLLMVLVAALVVSVSLVLLKVISKDCSGGSLFVMGVVSFNSELLSYIPTMYYGRIILRTLRKNEKSSLTETLTHGDVHFRGSLLDQYTVERKKQVNLVLIAYTASLVFRGLILAVSAIITDSDLFDCQEVDGIFIITSDYLIGQLLLIFVEINQLLPHVIIPVALYIVPVGRKKKNSSILLDQSISFLEDQEDDQNSSDKEDLIQSRVSSMITDRVSPTHSKLSTSSNSRGSPQDYKRFKNDNIF